MGTLEEMENNYYQRLWGSKYSFSVDENSRVVIAAKLLDGGKKLLDVGCGDSSLGLLVKNRYEQIYGIDISAKCVGIAKTKGIISKKVNLNIEPIPFPNEYFDTVACLDVIEHVIDPTRLIAEINRVLKKNGILVLSTPNIRKWSRIATLLILGKFPRTSIDDNGWDGGHIHYFTYSDIINLLEKNGFEIIGKYGFGVNFLKEFRSGGILIKAKKTFNH